MARRPLLTSSILAVSTAAMLLLSACSSGGSADPAAESEAAAPTASAGSPTGTDWDAVVDAAKQEGTVTYYSNDNAAIDEAIVAAFESKYPEIKVNYTRLSDQDLASRVLQEAESNINAVDVVRSGDPTLPEGNGAIFQPLTPDLLPILSKYPDDAFRHPWAVITAYSLYAIAYNTDSVKAGDVPKTWDDVLNPTFQDQINYTNPVGSATHMGWLEAMDSTYGPDFLPKFAKMGFEVQDSGTPGAQAVAAGAGKLALAVYPGNVTALIAQNAPIKYVIPTPTLVKPDSLMVMAKPSHPNAARVFANFRLDEDGIGAMCSATVAGTPLPDAKGCAEVPADAYRVKDLWTPEEALPYITAVGLKPTS